MLQIRQNLTAALLATITISLAACGGNDASSENTEAAPDTALVPETVAPEATAPIEFVVFTPDELVAALPTVDDLGVGWTDSGQTPLVNPEAKDGPGFGTCGGPNAAARAATTAATAVVAGPIVIGAGERRVSTSIYAFADDVTAQAFLDLTAELAQCPDGLTWERTQKANPVTETEFNGFGPGFEEVTENQIWTFTETATAEVGGETGDVVLVMVDRARELTAANITFRQTDTTINRYDRFDNLVIVTAITGTWDLEGFINLEELVNFQPTVADLDEYTATVQPLVLERLGWE